MKMKKKTISIILSGLLFLQGGAFADLIELSIWKERKQALKLARLSLPPVGVHPDHSHLHIPSHLGTLRGATHGQQRHVILIQDIHENEEAQTNIQETIQFLINKGKVDVVGLEGIDREMDLSQYQNYPYKDTTKQVIEYLLRENKITGPVAAGVLSGNQMVSFVGVDDAEEYKVNIEAYRESHKIQETRSKEIQNAKSKIQYEKERIFNKDLLAFDRWVEDYQNNKIEFYDYVTQLTKQAEQISLPLEYFIQAIQIERSLDFSEVERERSQLIEKILALNKQGISDQLMQMSLEFRMGQVDHNQIHQFLKKQAQAHNLSLVPFPQFNQYLEYLSLSDKIYPQETQAEIRKLEQSIYDELAQTEKERVLVKQSRDLYLMGKLVKFALTPDEWLEYKLIRHSRGGGNPPHRRPGESPPRRTRPVASQDLDQSQSRPWIKTFQGDPDASRRSSAFAEDDVRSFERFYQAAENRDKEMVQNLLISMDKNKSQSAVLVAGGFHSNGIKELLKEQDITVYSFTPKITHVNHEEGSSYLSVFTQKKTPLEKLFEGKKLYLAKNGALGLGWFPYLATTSREAKNPHRRLNAQRHFDDHFKNPDHDVITSHDIPNGAEVTRRSPGSKEADRIVVEYEGETIRNVQSDRVPSGTVVGPLSLAFMGITLLEKFKRWNLRRKVKQSTHTGLHTHTGGKAYETLSTEILVQYAQILIENGITPHFDTIELLKQFRVEDPKSTVGFIFDEDLDLAEQAAQQGANILYGQNWPKELVRRLQQNPNVLVIADIDPDDPQGAEEVIRFAAQTGVDGLMLKKYSIWKNQLAQIQREYQDLIIMASGGIVSTKALEENDGALRKIIPHAETLANIQAEFPGVVPAIAMNPNDKDTNTFETHVKEFVEDQERGKQPPVVTIALLRIVMNLSRFGLSFLPLNLRVYYSLKIYQYASLFDPIYINHVEFLETFSEFFKPKSFFGHSRRGLLLNDWDRIKNLINDHIDVAEPSYLEIDPMGPCDNDCRYCHMARGVSKDRLSREHILKLIRDVYRKNPNTFIRF